METRAQVHTKGKKKKKRQKRKRAKMSLAQVELEITCHDYEEKKIVTALGFLPLLTSHPFSKESSMWPNSHARAYFPLPRLPPQPICCWKEFKYVNERCFRRPINVIAFDIQHLHVWRRFRAPDSNGRPELFQRRDMWSIRRSQPSVPSPGCDLIFGAAAGERQFDGN